MRSLRLSVVLALALCSSGCGESSVADGVAQREANEIVAALRGRGIEATTAKERGSKGRYTVSVSSERFGEAASLLTELGLPENSNLSFGELVAPSGLLPSSREVEFLRLDRATASELEALLEQHPGVASAGVVVRMRAAPSGEPPSVSVVLQKRADSPLDQQSVRELTLRSVPGLKPEGIVLVVAEQRPVPASAQGDSSSLVPFLVFWRVPQEDYSGLSLLLLGLLMGLSAMAALGGYIYGQYALSRHSDAFRGEGLEAGRVQPTIAAPFERSRDDSDDDAGREP